MIPRVLKSTLRKVGGLVSTDPDRFLSDVTGLVHVGANTGQERAEYQAHGLKVLWIEPIPEVFARLSQNIAAFPRQRAFQALITDIDDKVYDFHVSSNNGESSSILELKHHRDIWPTVTHASSLPIKSVTLASFYKRERIAAADYQALVMDTQGSELLVLRGAAALLSGFQYIKTEVPDFESYAGCCQLSDMAEFMTGNGFKELSRQRFAKRDGGGSYYNITFKRRG